MFMKACTDTATGRKYCVVDALDECAQDEQATLLKQIKQTFGRDRSGGKLNVSLLVTSRPYSEIREHLQAFPNRDLASFEDSGRDIFKFINEKVAELKEMKHYTDAVAANVARVLSEKAGGIFLWVGLACQELEKVDSRKAVERLKKIPAGLQMLYQQLLDTALQQDEDPETIKQLLSFVMVARRPLSTRELASACDLYQDEGEEERIQFTAEAIASCRLMIVVQDDKVLLLHQSVRDFLVTGAGRNSSISELEAHNALASRCVGCLIVRSIHLKRKGRIKGESDLISYATQFWPEHAHMARSKFRIKDGQTQFFAIYSEECEGWWEDYSQGRPWEPSGLSIFHVAARWEIPSVVDYALSPEKGLAGAPVHETSAIPYIDSAYRDSSQTTPLEQCAKSGHIEVLKAMLDRADVTTPVAVAVVKATAGNGQNGNEIMELLLDRRGDQITITEEVVKAAAGNYRNGEEVMTLLLDRRGDQLSITEEVVKVAAGNYGNGEEVMTLLLDWQGDQVAITEEVVKAAAGNVGNGERVMRLLLDRRGDQVTITEEVVKAAAGNKYNGEKVMRLLLDRRGDQVTITEEVVKAAAGNEGNGEEVMKLLLDRRGDQVTITEEVFVAAATCGQDRVLNFLSQKTGHIPFKDEWRCIAQFYNAAKAGDVQVIERLLQESVKPDTKNIRGVTPLWIAASFGHNTVVESLVHRTDVDVNSTSVSNRPPLFWPASDGDESVVVTLMEAGADPAIMDCDGDTAISMARKNGHERIAKMLERSE